MVGDGDAKGDFTTGGDEGGLTFVCGEDGGDES